MAGSNFIEELFSIRILVSCYARRAHSNATWTLALSVRDLRLRSDVVQSSTRHSQNQSSANDQTRDDSITNNSCLGGQ